MQELLYELKGDARIAPAHPQNVAKTEGFSWDRVQAAMSAKNWTQADLARKSGLKESSLTHDKTGDSVPRSAELARMAGALGVSMDQLWGKQPMPNLKTDAGQLSKPESDLVVLYRHNERFRRIVNNIIAELDLEVSE